MLTHQGDLITANPLCLWSVMLAADRAGNKTTLAGKAFSKKVKYTKAGKTFSSWTASDQCRVYKLIYRAIAA